MIKQNLNFRNFKITTLEKCKYPNFGPEGLLSFYVLKKNVIDFEHKLREFQIENSYEQKTDMLL